MSRLKELSNSDVGHLRLRLTQTETDWDKFIQHNMTLYRSLTGHLRRDHPGETKKIAQQTKRVDVISEYLLWTNGQLFEMNVKIVSSYLQDGKAFDLLQHD